jgi:hypothetical protein
MKKVLGTLALMAVSAAAFVMPLAADERNDRGNDRGNDHNYSYRQQTVHEQAASYRNDRDRNDRDRNDRKPVAVTRQDRREPVRVSNNYRPVAQCR